MHLQFYSVIIKPSQTALASLQFGKHHLEKKKLECSQWRIQDFP